MRVIVTRPAVQAAEWVIELAARGIDAVALPLIGIAPVADARPVRDAWRLLACHRLVVFVSPNAVEQFFACRPSDAVWPTHTRAASPGPGTSRALRRVGLEDAQIVAPAVDAPQFDSEALWAELAATDWRDAQVLIVRGDGGREWLAETLAAHGARVTALAAYRRAAPVFGDADRALLAAATERPASHLWLFSSSEAIDHLAACAGAPPVAARAAGQALASHPRIAERARRFGFGTVRQVSPSLVTVVACIQSWSP